MEGCKEKNRSRSDMTISTNFWPQRLNNKTVVSYTLEEPTIT